MAKNKVHNPYGAYSAKEYERDHQMVKGRFRNIETPGASHKFGFRKYYSDGIKMYHLRDGEEAEIPMMVMDHLNQCGYVEEEQGMGLISPSGQPIGERKIRKKHRFAFVPTSFRRIDSELSKHAADIEFDVARSQAK